MDLISGGFLLFAAVTLLVYYALPLRLRPVWLLAVSVFFYLSADLRGGLFLLLSILSCYAAGLRLPKSRRRGLLLCLTLALNLGLLAALRLLPWMFAARIEDGTLRLLYPLGLSFYSLQAAGYVIDVYRGDIAPEKSLWRFALFLCFFPIVSQGPISRYGQLAPQLCGGCPLEAKNLRYGAQLMLWGYFKKMVVADRAGLLVDTVYAAPGQYAGFAVCLAALLYTLQLYADFSGCVDICRGVGQMLGIDVAENFRRPLFSTSIREFWRRWHITLGAWFRDYLYIPLGGSRKGRLRRDLNLMIVFGASGFWHGAGLNFLFWGLLHGFYQVAGGATLPWRDRFWRALGFRETPRLLRQLGCFFLVAFGFHFFRAQGLSAGLRMALDVVRGFDPAALSDGSLLSLSLDGKDMLVLWLALGLMLLVSLRQERLPGGCLRGRIAALPLPLRWGLWLALLLAVLILGIYGPGYDRAQFIYMGF